MLYMPDLPPHDISFIPSRGGYTTCRIQMSAPNPPPSLFYLSCPIYTAKPGNAKAVYWLFMTKRLVLFSVLRITPKWSGGCTLVTKGNRCWAPEDFPRAFHVLFF